MTAKIKNSGCKEFPYYLVMVGKKEFCATNNKENAQKIIELLAIAERMPTVEEIGFGSYVTVEQKRYGCDNEQYLHKVINRLKSNMWVEVPVQSPAKEVMHNYMEEVVSLICCGVSETEVLKFRIKDVRSRMEEKK
jgi:hypothetical protein